MSEQTSPAVDLMFRSPSPCLTMDFRRRAYVGPTSHPPSGHRICRREESDRNRKLTYVICTNSVNLTDELLNLADNMARLSRFRLTARCTCKNNHNNRGKQTAISVLLPVLQRLAKNWAKAGFRIDDDLGIRPAFRGDYRCLSENGFHSIFIRALNPYGSGERQCRLDCLLRSLR